MSFGASIKNSSGSELFYGAEKAFVFIEKGTTTFTSQTDWHMTSYNGDQQPQVFVVGGGAVLRMTRVNGYWGFCLYNLPTSGGSYTFSWLYFTPTPNVETVSYGLSVFSTTNELAYHSGYQPLQLVGYGSLSSSGNSYTISGSAIASVAVRALPFKTVKWTGSQVSGGYTVYYITTKSSGNVVSLAVRTTPKLGSAGIALRLGHWNSALVTAINADDY